MNRADAIIPSGVVRARTIMDRRLREPSGTKGKDIGAVRNSHFALFRDRGAVAFQILFAVRRLFKIV